LVKKQYVIYTKGRNIAKGIAKCYVNNVFLTKNTTTTKTTTTITTTTTTTTTLETKHKIPCLSQ